MPSTLTGEALKEYNRTKTHEHTQRELDKGFVYKRVKVHGSKLDQFARERHRWENSSKPVPPGVLPLTDAQKRRAAKAKAKQSKAA